MSSAALSPMDLYTGGAFTPYAREARLIGSAPIGMVEAAQPAGDFSDPPTAALTTIQIMGSPCRATCDVGAGEFSTICRAGDLVLVPPDVATQIIVDSPHVIRIFALPSVALREPLEQLRPGRGFDFGRLHEGRWRSDATSRLLHMLWEEGTGTGEGTRMLADTLMLSLIAALSRDAERSSGAENITRLRGGLAPHRLKRVVDLMNDRIADDLSLDELAAEAGLHPVYLVRAFRQATGTTPHRYLVERRIERARDLLKGTDLSLSEIAFACGFASQSHLSTWFKRLMGSTPSAFRAATGRRTTTR